MLNLYLSFNFSCRHLYMEKGLSSLFIARDIVLVYNFNDFGPVISNEGTQFTLHPFVLAKSLSNTQAGYENKRTGQDKEARND